ncbi:MAG: hypothetical protein M5U26_06530 [Planctomycetota bacterium]|nr:hypothetical protein [Planctomycetota bacterium]
MILLSPSTTFDNTPMRFAKLLTLSLALALLAPALRAEESAAEKALKQLDSADAAQRAAAETELRRLGKEALPALRTAKLQNEEAQVRLRDVLMDLQIEHAAIDETDANTVMQLSREEALAKRYSNAAKGYKRAQELYKRLEDDADDKKNKDKQKEFDGLKDKAEERRKKAERLAKGQGHKVSHWGPIPTIEKVTDDGDW